MAWSSLANNQWVSRNDLQDAVNTGVFNLNSGQTIPSGNNFITRQEAETWVNVTVTNGASNQWPQKSWLIANTTTTTVLPTTTTSSTSTTSTTSTTTIAPTTTTTTTVATTTSSTTTTTTTVHIQSFVVNVHNSTTDANIMQVHSSNSAAYTPAFTYPILPGDTQTVTDWPMTLFGTGTGIYVIKQATPWAFYHMDYYRNGVREYQEDSNSQVRDTTQYHFSSGYVPIGSDGDVIDIYFLPGTF